MPRNRNQLELAKEAWDILVRELRVMTYTEFAELLESSGYSAHAQSVKYPLKRITSCCDDHDWPRINDLVVNKGTGEPSYDVPPRYDFNDSQKNVRAFNWGAVAVSERDFDCL